MKITGTLILIFLSCLFFFLPLPLNKATSKLDYSGNKIDSTHTFSKISFTYGISKTTFDLRASQIVVTLSGISVSQKNADTWGSAILNSASNILTPALHYSFAGPNHEYFYNYEIDINKFIDDLLNEISKNKNISDIIFIAHSSGVFVAHEIFRRMYDLNQDSLKITSGKIHFFSMDGAIGKNQGIRLTQSSVNNLNKIYCVYAKNKISGDLSARSGDVLDLFNEFKDKTVLVELDASESGCLKEAKWCLHQYLVNKKPYNSKGFDFINDYGNISASNPVNIDYLYYLTK
ncbi:MAG: hypothetical protein IAE91_12795 [Ignavibacteriaceae bacterium]|nr:hypothetical protein [Ignavibacteriaceae bacterium]